MSKINSIVLGISSGAIGSVITAYYNKQVIARSRNTIISTNPTDEQIKCQNKMFNCKNVYQYISNFLINWKPKKNKYLTIDNYFTYVYLPYFLSFRALKPIFGVRQLEGLIVGKCSYLRLNSCVLLYSNGVKNGARIYFNKIALGANKPTTVYLWAQHIVNPQSPYPVVNILEVSKVLTNTDISERYFDIDLPNFNCQFLICYSTTAGKQSDNILFSPVFPN